MNKETITYSEMMSQYKAMAATLSYMNEQKTDLKRFLHDNPHFSVTYIGSGSGYCLCQSAAITTSMRSGIPAYSLPAGDLLLNHDRYRSMLKNTLLVAPSRSGSTTEVIEAVGFLKKELGIPVLAITCVSGSPLSLMADKVLELPWAYDDSVCQTRTVSNLYMADLLLIEYMTGATELYEQFSRMIAQGEEYLTRLEKDIREIANIRFTDIVILADAEMQGIAAEGAMAFTEIAQIPARYFHVLDVRHGPMVLINQNSLVIFHRSEFHVEMQDKLIEEILERGATVIVYHDGEGKIPAGVHMSVTTRLALDMAVAGIPFINICQLMSYDMAMLKDIQPDNPEGITAWVKL